jgi:HAD superfamily, subfamily IIIB (Acid phosphatase)
MPHSLRGLALSALTAALLLCLQPAAMPAMLALHFTAAAATRAEVPVGCAPPPPAQNLGRSRPINLGLLKRRLLYYRCTRYDTDIAAVLRHARTYVEWRAHQVKKPALVLDIDETSLSNWKRIYQNDFAFVLYGGCDFKKGTACGEIAWEKSASAPAIVPTLALFKAARARHVAVFFVTGRPEGDEVRRATKRNLENAGYDGFQHLYLRTKDFAGPSVIPFKTWARRDIERQGYRVIANVGDQWSDLSGGHAERIFKVPDPFYYLP